MALPDKAPLLGVGISVTTYAQVVNCIIEAAQAKRSLLVSACAVHALMEAIDDPVFGAVLNRFEIVAPDGQPIRWGLNWAHHANLRERVYGPSLMLKVCQAAVPENLSVYLYGSREHTLQRLAEKLTQRTPGLRIAGQRAGRFRALSASEQAEDARAIVDSGASIVFVGMGAPRQDWWIFHMRDRIPLPMLALGAAFDFNAGLIAQAPTLMQDHGLEWLFRLSREPKRLWRRYLTLTPRYLPLIATQVLGLRTFSAHVDLHEADERPCPG